MASVLGDITANLKSLSFDAGLTEEEKDLIFVRKRSHAARTCMIGQACYLVSIINEGKKLIFEQEKKETVKQDNPWKVVQKRRPLRIGVLGCGAIGRSLVRNLQKFADLHPEEILISTRRPELLTEFIDAGIQCFFDNKKLVKSTDLTFICCLPSHLEDIIEEIKGRVKCLLYSFVAGFPRIKLCKRLSFFDIIKPEFILGDMETTSDSNWNYKQSISQALETASTCEVSCPGNNKKDIITTPWKLAELMFFVFVNMCIVQGILRPDIIKMVNSVIFGLGNEDECPMLTEMDVWNLNSNKTLIPISLNERQCHIFSIDKLHNTKTEIGSTLGDLQNPLGARFRKRYVQLFDKLCSWKTHCELVQT